MCARGITFLFAIPHGQDTDCSEKVCQGGESDGSDGCEANDKCDAMCVGGSECGEDCSKNTSCDNVCRGGSDDRTLECSGKDASVTGAKGVRDCHGWCSARRKQIADILVTTRFFFRVRRSRSR